MDKFYVAVEERRRPELRGRPVIVGADPKAGQGRGVVAACNYEARKLGVRSGMPIRWAWRRCGPRATYLPPDMDAYVEASRQVMARLKARADRFEPASIDEAFLDVTEAAGADFDRARDLARAIKADVREGEGLTCSIGIGPNKLVAKVASDFQKPDGLTVVRAGEAEAFLAPLDASVLWGVGPKTRARLAALGIRTCGDLARTDGERLRAALGPSWGEALREEARGIGPTEVVTEWEPKSLGRETTFDEDQADAGAVLAALDELVRDVHERVAEEGYRFRTVTVKVRFHDFETHTRQRTLRTGPTDRLEVLREVARDLLASYLGGPKRVRLVGVQASGLERAEPEGSGLRASGPPP